MEVRRSATLRRRICEEFVPLREDLENGVVQSWRNVSSPGDRASQISASANCSSGRLPSMPAVTS